jgi:hypothetical protein
MRKQYHFRPSKNGFYAWDVDKLVEKAENLPVHTVKLEEITELDENFWYQSSDTIPTVRSVAEHMRLTNETDLNYPILLSSNGRVMDGIHRVIKALIEGLDEITAVKFDIDPTPDYEDVQPSELPYDS